MSNELLIYAVVGLNALVQLTLILRLRFPEGGKWKYGVAVVAAPLLLLLLMRLLVASGVVNARVAEQTLFERVLTQGAGVLLLVSPWIVTTLAVTSKKRRAALARATAAAAAAAENKPA